MKAKGKSYSSKKLYSMVLEACRRIRESKKLNNNMFMSCHQLQPLLIVTFISRLSSFIKVFRLLLLHLYVWLHHAQWCMLAVLTPACWRDEVSLNEIWVYVFERRSSILWHHSEFGSQSWFRWKLGTSSTQRQRFWPSLLVAAVVRGFMFPGCPLVHPSLMTMISQKRPWRNLFKFGTNVHSDELVRFWWSKVTVWWH